MSKKLFIGIDNGVSGSISSVGDIVSYHQTPVKEVLNYTKTVSKLNRLDIVRFKNILRDLIGKYKTEDIIIAIERPLVNPGRFKATLSAIRCLEATLICLEDLELPYFYIDSKEWQKTMLPKGVKGSSELKKASLDVGNRLFPQFKDLKHKDRDSLLIAEHLRKTYE